MLLWNPNESLSEQEFLTWIEENNGIGDWSVGRLPVKRGDLCFIRRCRTDPGIVTYGNVTSEAYPSDHWRLHHGTETDHQKPQENFADVIFQEWSLDRPILVSALKLLGFGHLPWRSRQPTPISLNDGAALKAICDSIWKTFKPRKQRKH